MRVKSTIEKTISGPLTTFETASRVRISPCTIHGCRPTSAVIQPSWMAIIGSGMDQKAIRCHQRASSSRPRQIRNSPSSAISSMSPPRITMWWNERNVIASGGQSVGGKSRRPLTSRLEVAEGQHRGGLGQRDAGPSRGPCCVGGSTKTTSGAPHLRVEQPLHRRELDRLRARHLLGVVVAGGDVEQRSRRTAIDRAQLERDARHVRAAPLEVVPGGDAGHEEGPHRPAGRDACGGSAARSRG